MSTKLELFAGDVLVLRDEPEAETKQGILLPDRALKPKFCGTVFLSAKNMKDGSPSRFKEGDRVRFRQHLTGDFCNVEVEGETYMLMPSEWVWALESPS